MAFGAPKKYNTGLNPEGLEREDFLIVAIETAEKLNWEVKYINESGFIASTKLSISSWSEKITVTFNNETANIQSECTGSQVIDWGKNKKNVEEFTKTFKETRAVLSSEEVEEKRLTLKQKYKAEEIDELDTEPLSGKDKAKSFFSLFLPTEGYFVTPLILIANILIFLIMVASGVDFMEPEGEALLDWGANFRPVTLDGQWWRLLTSCFIHIGIMHLAMNMYALLYVGSLLEPYLGKTRFAAAYFLSGATASLISLWWHELTISAGASGAVFGMYGVFLALLTTDIIDKSARNALLSSIGIFVGYNLLMGLQPGIDNAAHMGGLISGFVIGYAFIPGITTYQSFNFKVSTIGLLTAAVVVSSALTFGSLSNDLGLYDKRLEEFMTTEAKAMEFYDLPNDSPKEQLLSELKENVIPSWEKNMELVESLDELDLPIELQVQNETLMEYCELRIKSCKLLYKTIEEDTDSYKYQLNEYNQRIDKIVNGL